MSKFATLNFSMQNQTELLDENQQGEATMVEQLSDRLTGKKVYLESYGCQMNFSDSEIVASIMANAGFETTRNANDADVILLNTCAIRDNAEQRIRNRLKQFNAEKVQNPNKVIGILGCMAERLKSQLLEEEKLVDIVAGPDAYRDLPNLVLELESGQKGR